MLESPYLTDQLIPYIGNKRKLLPLLHEAIHSTGITGGAFLDLFSGSGVVSRLAKVMGYRVIANDWEPYSACINRAYIAQNSLPLFARLGGVDEVFNRLNSLPPVRGYIATHYCPEDDENPSLDRERMFYTQENGQKIDAIREQVKLWHDGGLLSQDEESLILSTLIFQAAYCSNTSGVFKGFHRGWGGATKTAWYRIRSTLTLSPPTLWDNGQKNAVTRADANRVAREVRADIAYIDPPYNQHQYGPNYHMLNTVALWDKPQVSRYFYVEGRKVNKSAIRTDWRTERRSPYCYRSTAEEALCELISGVQADCILVSYSTDGIIAVDKLLGMLSEQGKLWVMPRRYKRYRVSSQRPSPRPHTVEFVAIADRRKRPSNMDVPEAVESIAEAAL